MRIVLTGGASGGHLTPLVAVAKKIKEKRPDAEFIFIGPSGRLEQDIIGKEGILMRNILVGKMRRYFSFHNLVDAVKVPLGVIQCLALLLYYMPDAVFSKGGHASFPVVVAAWLYRIPIFIHESDARPGVANSMLDKLSNRIAISYAEAERYFLSSKTVLTGTPVRDDINKGSAAVAREKYHLLESKKTIFILGGSQGARSINDKILDILPEILSRYQVIHQTGQGNFEEVSHRAGELGFKTGHDGYWALPFIGDDINDIYAVADLVISRSGGTSISEIAANGKPSIIIPLATSANDHQRMNAFALAQVGACVVLEEDNLGEHLLLKNINDLMNDQELRDKLSVNIASFYHPDAAEKIADGVLGMIEE
ncbi:MAG: undecaprenyldiphospho-muramoylpentapeptide beta-N-acetylglucosaminyltransferase [Candidatus Moranbacteria bacterium]|nr:undecaprenyldiphospho-muramoylpentapeptide beta-N-acetylglucosaminyltransferase [Candidatus Moranbacteria bacterium]